MPGSKVAKVESKPQPKPEPLNDEAMKGIWVDGIGLHIGADYVILEGTIGKPRTEKNYVVSRIMFPTRILEQVCKAIENVLKMKKEMEAKQTKESK